MSSSNTNVNYLHVCVCFTLTILTMNAFIMNINCAPTTSKDSQNLLIHRIVRSLPDGFYENALQEREYPDGVFNERQLMRSAEKRAAAMGVDLPDYILHYKNQWPNLGSFREKMQKSGK